MQRAIPPRRLALAIGCSMIMLAAVACTERETVTGTGPLPVAATAYPSPTGSDGPVAVDPPQDMQELRIGIVAGRFDADRYDVQPRATRAYVTAQGGPYTLSIEDVLQPRQLPADPTTSIGLSLSRPGEYAMQLTGGDRAVLNVRPTGGR